MAGAVRDWLLRYRSTVVHASRITLASLAAYGLVRVLGLSEGLWAVVAAIVVSQSSIGGSLKSAFVQLVGSLFGAVYGTGVALMLSPTNPLSMVLALAVGLAPPAILAARSPEFRIAPITAAIILLGGAELGMGPLSLAANRIAEVGIGCATGILISVLVAPTRASRSVVNTASQTAELMAAQLQALASGDPAAQAQLGLLAIRIRDNLTRLAILVKEAEREQRSWLTNTLDGPRLLRTLRRLRHDIDMLRRAARGAGGDALHEYVSRPWVRAAEAGAAALRRIGRQLSGNPAKDADDLKQAVRAYRAALDEMRQAGLTRPLSSAAIGRLFGIGFALDQFRRDLNDLEELSIAGVGSVDKSSDVK